MDFFSTNLFNWYGLAFAIALLVPDIVYIKSNRIDRTIFDNRAMLYIERIGKYCSIFLMGINIGVLEGGFTKPIMETFWIISTCVLTVVALILWLLCFNRFSKLWAYLLTAVTAVIFMMSGLLQVKTLLLTAGVVYLIGQLYVTNKYVKSKMQYSCKNFFVTFSSFLLFIFMLSKERYFRGKITPSFRGFLALQK